MDRDKTNRDDIKRWTVLLLSLWGRAEVIKKNILVRLAFLVSAIPLQFPQHWFKEILHMVYFQACRKKRNQELTTKKRPCQEVRVG